MSDSEFEQAKLECERTRALPALPATPEPAATRPRSFEDEQRQTQIRSSQRSGVWQPVDIIQHTPDADTRDAETLRQHADPARVVTSSQRARYDQNLGAEHGSPPPPRA